MTTKTLIQSIELLPLDIAPFVIIISIIGGWLGLIDISNMCENSHYNSFIC